MAFLSITEYAEEQIGPAGRVGQMPLAPPVAYQAIANAGGNNVSNAFNSKTRFIRLHTDSTCCYDIAFVPVAIGLGATMTSRLVAGQTEYVGVPLGQGFKIAAILST